MKKLLYYFLFLPIVLCAQSNKSDTLRVKTSLSVTGFYQSGNVDALIFRVNSTLRLKLVENWVFKTKNSYVYQEFGKNKADEDILSLNFLYFNPDQKIYPLLLGFVSTNFRREIALRSLFGAGVMYQVLNHDKYWLKLAISSEYEQTRFRRDAFNRSAYDGNQAINTLRGTIWINGNYHLFKKKIILKHELYFQPSLEQSNNFRWQADVSIELPIWTFLSFQINYLQMFESIVIKNQKQEDRFLTFGLSLKNY
jgi:hypothetical protein